MIGGRALRTVRREVAFEAVLVVVAGGLVYTNVHPTHWLRGVIVMGAGMLLGGVLRLVLPARQAGLLAARSRAFDAICYLALGVLVITFAVLLPR